MRNSKITRYVRLIKKSQDMQREGKNNNIFRQYFEWSEPFWTHRESIRTHQFILR